GVPGEYRHCAPHVAAAAAAVDATVRLLELRQEDAAALLRIDRLVAVVEQRREHLSDPVSKRYLSDDRRGADVRHLARHALLVVGAEERGGQRGGARRPARVHNASAALTATR